MEQHAVFKSISLKEMWSIFLQRLWAIVLAACVVGGGLFALDRVTFVPQYESTATLYILRQADGTSASETSTDFSLALKVVNDCTYLLKSHTVLDELISDLALDMEYDDLYDSISTANPEDTRILEVTVKADSPENAKQIVDKVCSIGSQRIEDAMGFRQVNLYEFGIIDPEPCNRVRIMTFGIIGVAAAIITYAVFLLIFLLDDRIKTDEEIQQLTGLSILGSIPSADSKKTSKYGYYKAYGQPAKKTQPHGKQGEKKK